MRSGHYKRTPCAKSASITSAEISSSGYVENPGDSTSINTLRDGSKCLEEVYEVSLLLVSEADVEPLIVELHDIRERRRRAVVKIRRARCQAPQDWNLDRADVFAIAGYQRPARIDDVADLTHERTGRVVALNREHRQAGNIERRDRRRIRGAGSK